MTSSSKRTGTLSQKSALEPIHVGILVEGQLLRIIIREAFLG